MSKMGAGRHEPDPDILRDCPVQEMQEMQESIKPEGQTE